MKMLEKIYINYNYIYKLAQEYVSKNVKIDKITYSSHTGTL